MHPSTFLPPFIIHHQQLGDFLFAFVVGSVCCSLFFDPEGTEELANLGGVVDREEKVIWGKTEYPFQLGVHEIRSPIKK